MDDDIDLEAGLTNIAEVSKKLIVGAATGNTDAVCESVINKALPVVAGVGGEQHFLLS